MSEEKLSSDKVPAKFAEWLLSMGCPPEKVPSIDKVTEMCRGQYYMVWRSIMEHVEPCDVVRTKRLQVFIDDVHRCQERKVFSEHNSNIVVPEQYSLWRQQTELKQKVADTRTRVDLAQQNLNQLTDRISIKLSQRKLSRRRTDEVRRRAWLLRRLAEELVTKKETLRETRTIADSLCSIDDDTDIQSKLDRCVSSLLRQSSSSAGQLPTPIASSSVVSNNGEATELEEHLSSLVKCRGDALCSQLCSRRAGLLRALAAGGGRDASANNKVTPQSVLARTAGLHCSLTLEAAKNKVHLKHAHAKLVAAVGELNNYLSGEACELLVVRCEKAHVQARVDSLRCSLDELTARSGVFHAGDVPERSVAGKGVRAVDKAIVSKRDELKRVITSLAATERKIQNVKECLITVFNGFNGDCGIDKSRGSQLDLPQESFATLRQFYEGRRERRKKKIDISLDLEVSESSITDFYDANNPTFVDELKIYLKKFQLEKNRKLVLESGEQMWISETLQSCLDRLHSRWLSDEVVCSLLSPANSLESNVASLVGLIGYRRELREMLKGVDCDVVVQEIDTTPQEEEETQKTDAIKKRLREGLRLLQVSTSTLALGREDLELWSGNRWRHYLSPGRLVRGLPYAQHETCYFETCVDM